MALPKGLSVDGSDALWNGDTPHMIGIIKGTIADAGYNVAAQLCGYVDVVGADVNRFNKLCDGCSIVCIYRIVILVTVNDGFLSS